MENLRGALTRYYPSIPAHLVEPVREHPEGGHEGWMGPEERLPLVRRVGLFSSRSIKRGPACFSRLAVAWYQLGPELTDLAGAVPGLVGLPRDELAEDCEY
ncbi:hypothetical protein [Kitasatospora saccharophila]|uniref:hypothetical protein n=1 Tax=Kitasatospora saccharophila TaxID=407973 RepID=UPI0031D0E007